MRIVYTITPDLDKYQYFLPRQPDDSEKFYTTCESKMKRWKPPEVFIYEPFLLKGDFFQQSHSYLITSPKATQMLKTYFEERGEILPLPYEGDIYGYINITACFDCLNKEKTIFRPSGLPEEYVFDTNWLPYPGLFKIPETRLGELLVLVDTSAPSSDDFRESVERNNLSGLIFRELWRGET